MFLAPFEWKWELRGGLCRPLSVCVCVFRVYKRIFGTSWAGEMVGEPQMVVDGGWHPCLCAPRGVSITIDTTLVFGLWTQRSFVWAWRGTQLGEFRRGLSSFYSVFHWCLEREDRGNGEQKVFQPCKLLREVWSGCSQSPSESYDSSLLLPLKIEKPVD